MKNNVRKALAISGLALAIGASGFTLEASASTASTDRVQRSHQERIFKARKFDNTEKHVPGRKIAMGVVTAINDGSLTIKRGAKTFTVNIATETRILNRQWKNVALSNITVGNKIRVFGTITDTTVAAKTVRDISIL